MTKQEALDLAIVTAKDLMHSGILISVVELAKWLVGDEKRD